MSKMAWVILIGGIVTFIVYQTNRAWTWLAGASTAAAVFWQWKKG